MSFAIRTGCVVEMTKAYFTGPYRRCKFAGEVGLKLKVLRHSYGADKGQHTFTCEVLEVLTETIDAAHKVSDTFRVKGRNLYPYVTRHTQGKESLELNFEL